MYLDNSFGRELIIWVSQANGLQEDSIQDCLILEGSLNLADILDSLCGRTNQWLT